jgi:hypothetical protein
MVFGQAGQHPGDVAEGETDLLGGADHGQPPEHVTAVAALTAGGPGAVEQAVGLVEPQRRDGEARSLGNGTDGEEVVVRFGPRPRV